ncbi:hypothetical protein [Caviibacterium pharyngocola]|uniref:Glucose-6-phosphate isomerase n=1 Tax=Caviibacterium pharyngocola TaxID=28159 RepID=A0A2M8RWW1_9PAST|nr:hypothetical protein [Caviibacterium pharyngocola]PJG83379.1 hypothetical protein CVP04_04455 [Caviibacterium pharyngocola]
MKKAALALTVLLGLGLTACSSNTDENTYKGEVLFSAYEGNNLKLTVRQNDCDRPDGKVETVELVHPYDSNLVVGSCVLVSKDDNGVSITNISRSKSASWLSRTGKH